MLTVKCPLHFLGTSGGNIMPCGARNISEILLHSEQFCEIVEWPVTVGQQL
jgi:hypothetical protein